ncbi:HIT family protein [Endozoicomonas montiporae]|uniref:HIT family protein n=1 Tax=Endozoicomonas montiporae TaxID=1027273 RepID=UPI001C9E0669|nr:HIT domain-containing protein [Endozoicomonas montiporae]
MFCAISRDRVIDSNSLAYAIRDRFPVSELHALVIPKRHVETYFELNSAEVCAIHQLLKVQKRKIEQIDTSVSGFNIGMNCGKDSGQTIFHCHVHLIPRRVGDVANPKGGIRHMIPGKGDYTLSNTRLTRSAVTTFITKT